LRVRKQPQPGDVLDGIYRLDQPLGKGGIGVVYRAFHLHLQRPCAIKFMHPQLVSNAELRTRFRREAQSAFQLGHPHIVAITDFRDDPSAWPYLVMELVVGETLRDRLEHGALEPPLGLHLMLELADALSAAHRRGVIHRDLKPENLFLTRVSSAGPGELDITLKVLDFGLSKLLDGVEITGSGRLLGSPSYMSPEQARGDSHLVDARSDIFSVGALLYECLTGEKMFNGETLEQKRQQIIAAQLPPLRFAERKLPQLDKIIARACALKPEHRYQTASALHEALSEAEKALKEQLAKPAPLLALSPSPVAAKPKSERSSTVASVGGGEIIANRDTSRRRRAGIWLFAIPASLTAVALVSLASYSAWRAPAVRPAEVILPTAHPTGQPELPPADPPVITPIREPVTPPPTVTPTVQAETTPAGSQAAPGRPAALALPLRLADDNVTALRPTPTVATAPFPSAAARWRRTRSAARPIAVGPTPAAPAARTGATLLEVVQLAKDTLRRASPAVKRCYPENVAPPDKISVDITIQADGRVSEANIDGAEDGAACVLRVLHGLRFSAPSDTDSYGTRYDFVNLRR
jgi:serine/threonine-protein kinase